MIDQVCLALDYGTKRVGLAISRGTLAEPLFVLPNDDKLLDNIAGTCQLNSVKAIVLGVSEGEMAKTTKEFGEQLKVHLGLPVFLVDETLSSSITQEKIKVLKKKKRSGAIDHYAAAVFLQDWLDGVGEI